jgi:hypothetical protein
MAVLQERARRAAPRLPRGDEVYEAWRKIGYNVAQLRRYLADSDPTAQLAVDLRLLYGLFEVVLHHFTLRHLPWRGETAAVRYWAEHDSAYLDVLWRCLEEPDRTRKSGLYEELARLTVAPIGPLWEVGTTMVALGPGWPGGAKMETTDAGMIEDAIAFWQALIEEKHVS